jgi:hypothetical protein
MMIAHGNHRDTKATENDPTFLAGGLGRLVAFPPTNGSMCVPRDLRVSVGDVRLRRTTCA